MQPDKVVVRQVRLRLRTPFVSALGAEYERDIIIVEVHAEGYIGYGEVPVLAGPVYNEETVETAWHVLNDFFIEPVLAEPLTGPDDVPARLAGFKGHAFARAGLEAAVWDAWARRDDVSLQQLLSSYHPSAVPGSADPSRPRSRAVAERVPSGVVVGMTGAGAEGEAELLRQVGAYLEQRYRRIKIKIQPGMDEAPLRAIRRTFGDIELAVDANGTYSADDVAQLRALEQFNLSFIEQPLAAPDIIDHASVQRSVQIAVGLDESIGSLRQAEQAVQLGSCRIVNIKASRLGGLTEALAVHDLCRAHKISVLCGGLLESGIGRAHNVALASLPGFNLPGDLSASARYWERDIVIPAFTLDEDGYVPVPTGPGIGVDVDRDYLQSLTVRKRVHAQA